MSARFDVLLSWLERWGKPRPKGRARVDRGQHYRGVPSHVVRERPAAERARSSAETQQLPRVVDEPELAYAEAGSS